MNQQIIQKNYYEQLILGNYIDVKYSEQQWKIAKLIDKDKKYAVVTFEGINSKEQQIYLHGHKAAPLRYHTEGYTGLLPLPSPTINMSPFHYSAFVNFTKDLFKYFLTKCLYINTVSTRIIICNGSQFINSLIDDGRRLQLGIEVFARICLVRCQVQCAGPEDEQRSSFKYNQYFEGIGSFKGAYLVNDSVAYVSCLNQLLILLNLIVKAEQSKHIALFRSKHINQDALVKYFLDLKHIGIFAELFKTNDKNGKWLPQKVGKHLYFLLKKFSPKLTLPDYNIRDYSQVFSIYPFMLKEEQKQNTVEEKYLLFIVGCLKEQSSFQTKMKAIQQLKKVLDGDVKLFRNDEKQIFTLVSQQGIIDHMLSQYHFNPEIFKRFTPVLQRYVKNKALSMKNITSLLKLTKNRHESEVNVIFQIICLLAEFVQIDALDYMYGQILKFPLNNNDTLKLIRDFTINSIINYSKQKSFFSSFFKKTKNSSKYGFYGLDLFFRELQDDGAIDESHLQIVFEMVKDMFSIQVFQGERNNYMSICLSWLQKIKNYGQSIKLLDIIVSTYPLTSFLSQTQRSILQKLLTKNNLVSLMIFGLKNREKVSEKKLKLAVIIKSIFAFLENYYEIVIGFIKIEHIEFLWTLGENKLLSNFIRKNRPSEIKKNFKEKYIKKIGEGVQQEILLKLAHKKSFYERNLSIEEFEALDQIFISFNLIKKKIDISELGIQRYITPDLEGTSFYFNFLQKMVDSPHIEKIIKKTIQIYLRPKDQTNLDLKVDTWKICLLKMVQKLKANSQICLRAINLFFQMIEGKMIKLNLTFTGNIQIFVSLEDQQKTIVLARNCTIFKLRKQIMQEFNINTDFTLFSVGMKRDITFVQEEQYSLNALTNASSFEKGPKIKITNIRKEKHPQIQAVCRFHRLIEKQEKFYNSLFQLHNEKVHQYFWKTVQLLPVNCHLIQKIENCVSFTNKQWLMLLKNQTPESLQYHLNIIHEIIDNNKKWIPLFITTGGLSTVIDILSARLREEYIKERIINRCILIVVQVLQTENNLQKELLQELELSLIAKVIFIFRGSVQSVSVSVDCLSNIFGLLSRLQRVIETRRVFVEVEIILRLVQYVIFKPKSKTTQCFIENEIQNHLARYHKDEQKQLILQRLLSFLSIPLLHQQQHYQLLFLLIIDFINSPHTLLSSPHLTYIQNFVINLINGPHLDHSKNIPSQMLVGALKLLNFTLNLSHTYPLQEIFKTLVQKHLFSHNKVKHEVTLKHLYENIKKILFLEPAFINIITQRVAPSLQHNQWRDNQYLSWQIESKKQEKNIYCGLQNLGATCYINCLLQQLFMIPYFKNHFISIDSHSYKPSPENEILQLQQIMASLQFSNKKSISTKPFCDSFITYEGVPINPLLQSDADEFLNQLMQKIESFLKDTHQHQLIENTFEGTLSNQLNCQGCPHKSQKEDHFLSIGVNIKGKKTLEEALEGFVEGEILDGDNAYFCQLCQKKVRTQKRLCIKTLPNILTIVIKRFQFNYDQMRKIKINSYLRFPSHLNMKPFTSDFLGGAQDLPDESYQYDLRGTVIHSGTSEGGHYYSLIKEEGKWFCFNDEFIEEIKECRVQEDGFGGEDKSAEGQFRFEKFKNAYILFYEKKNPSQHYSRNTEEVMSSFSEELKESVLTENKNSEFLSVILDSNFIRLTQNFTALELEQAHHFSFLYFHTVVLRDKNKDEHIPNYYRILDSLLQKQSLSLWYLSQINHQFIRQFLIEAPRTTRFVCTSLILKALLILKSPPINFVQHCLFSLRKSGMTPFAKVFKKLSANPQVHNKLVEYEYPLRAMNLLLERSNQNFKMLQVESFESYFGVDSAVRQKQVEPCMSSLCESLLNFEVSFQDAYLVFMKYNSREGSKVLANKLAKNISSERLGMILLQLETVMLREGEFKRQNMEKYFYFIRYVCFQSDKNEEWKIDNCIQSFKKIIYECRLYYQPMEYLLYEINYIAFKSVVFRNKWKSTILQKQNQYDMSKTLRYWLKEAERPQFLYKSDDFKRKIASLSYEEKNEIQQKNKIILEHKMTWMLEKDSSEPEILQSDIQDAPLNTPLVVRGKQFKIKEHLGLIKKIQIDNNERWAFIQRNQLDLYHSL